MKKTLILWGGPEPSRRRSPGHRIAAGQLILRRPAAQAAASERQEVRLGNCERKARTAPNSPQGSLLPWGPWPRSSSICSVSCALRRELAGSSAQPAHGWRNTTGYSRRRKQRQQVVGNTVTAPGVIAFIEQSCRRAIISMPHKEN
jgi:hypothetical protein